MYVSASENKIVCTMIGKMYKCDSEAICEQSFWIKEPLYPGFWLPLLYCTSDYLVGKTQEGAIFSI